MKPSLLSKTTSPCKTGVSLRFRAFLIKVISILVIVLFVVVTDADGAIDMALTPWDISESMISLLI